MWVRNINIIWLRVINFWQELWQIWWDLDSLLWFRIQTRKQKLEAFSLSSQKNFSGMSKALFSVTFRKDNICVLLKMPIIEIIQKDNYVLDNKVKYLLYWQHNMVIDKGYMVYKERECFFYIIMIVCILQTQCLKPMKKLECEIMPRLPYNLNLALWLIFCLVHSRSFYEELRFTAMKEKLWVKLAQAWRQRVLCCRLKKLVEWQG